MKARDRAIELSYVAAWRTVRLMPQPAATALFRAGADRSARKPGAAVRRLAANLRQVVGPDMPADEFDGLIRDALRSYARYWMEAFRLPSRTREQNRAGFRLIGESLLREHYAAGQGVVLALPHAGNWDAAGAWVASNGWPITTVAERLKPESVFRRFLAFREGLGMEILPLTGGERAPLEVLADRVRAGHMVPLLSDRDFSARGVEVDFFGQKAKMPPGPAILALRTGAPLYAVDMWYDADVPVGQLNGPIELPDESSGSLNERVRSVTQMIANQFEAGIRRRPCDWHMLARMFIEPSAAALAADAGGF